MAVDDEVRVADFVELDARKALGAEGELADAFPAPAKRLAARKEETVEIAIPAERSDDAVERNVDQTAVDAVAETQLLADCTKGRRSGGRPRRRARRSTSSA
jgi:hypothetical protein